MGSLTAVWQCEGVTFHREEHTEGAVRVPGWQRVFPRGEPGCSPAGTAVCTVHTFCARQPHICFPRCAGAPHLPVRRAVAASSRPGPLLWQHPGQGDSSRSRSSTSQDGTNSRQPPPHLQTHCAHAVRSSQKTAPRYSFLAVPFPS